MGLPAQEVYPDVQSREVVLVQGIIDVFLKKRTELCFWTIKRTE